MTERPIPFRDWEVRAILRGDKTQTRRKMKVQPQGHYWETLPGYKLKHTEAVLAHGKVAVMFRHTIPQNPSPDFENAWISCPYGKPGDLLWVREAWRAWSQYDDWPPSRLPPGVDVQYIADASAPWASRYRHARFMPRWASRITLRITDVRVERLQDISEDDARAEGWPGPFTETGFPIASPLAWFANVWTSINGPGAWEANPWVWAISFERVKP
jgi:hypothetical protein